MHKYCQTYRTFIKNQLEYYKTCAELPLKVFFEVAETGNINLLVTDGKVENDILLEVWEKLIAEYAQIDNNKIIADVLDKTDQVFKQAALYCEVKAMFLYLIGAYKQEYVDRLKSLGYKVDMDNRPAMIESIQRGDNRSNHIATKMQILQKDIEKYSSKKRTSFDGAMAWLSSNLGFEPNDNLSVLRYLEYKKQIAERAKAKRK